MVQRRKKQLSGAKYVRSIQVYPPASECYMPMLEPAIERTLLALARLIARVPRDKLQAEIFELESAIKILSAEYSTTIELMRRVVASGDTMLANEYLKRIPINESEGNGKEGKH